MVTKSSTSIGKRTDVRNESNYTTITPPKKKKSKITENAVPATPPTQISSSTIQRRTERYAAEFDESKFWVLKSGTRVEEVLMEVNLTRMATVKTRSFTIDFNCPLTRSLFTPQDWAELMKLNSFELPLLPNTTIDYVLSLGTALEKGDDVAGVTLPSVDTEACEILRLTFIIWSRLYRKTAFLASLSESYWARKAWPLLYDLLEEVTEIIGLDGEKMGIESSRRKNQSRDTIQVNNDPNTGPARKRIGRKLDLIARDMVNKKDWFLVERMNVWDPHSTKFIRESGIDLFRETHVQGRGRNKSSHIVSEDDDGKEEGSLY